MPINKVRIGNFKGVDAAQDFEIKPVTIFIGANSSGKSSVIHGLMALAQTLKLGNTAPAIVLDDDYAHVHLGRFSEIAHTRDYTRPIELGITIPHAKVPSLHSTLEKGGLKMVDGECVADYEFSSTLRTQDVYVSSAKLAVADNEVIVRRGVKKPYAYSASEGSGSFRFPVERTNFPRCSAYTLISFRPSAEPM